MLRMKILKGRERTTTREQGSSEDAKRAASFASKNLEGSEPNLRSTPGAQ
jgi:hypothetical protein